MKVAIVTDNPMLYEKTMYLNELRKEMEKKEIEINVLAIRTPYWLLFDRTIPIYRFMATGVFVQEIFNCDIVHVQFTFPIGFLLSFLKGIHKKPVVIHTHGDDVFIVPSASIGFRRTGIGRFVTKITWEATSHIIAVCKKAKQEIMNVGISGSKISVLYNGVNEKFFYRRTKVEDDRLASIRESSDMIFLNVANLKSVKNQIRLLIAFSYFMKKSKSNQNVKLIICGIGRLGKQLRDTTRMLSIEDNVVFLGKLPHYKMPELYCIADAFVLPSLHEAHPWSLLEAMSCELPVAASNVGGIPETITNKRLLFNPWKTYDICEAMDYLSKVSKRRKQLGLKNRKILLKKFTLEKHVTKLNSIYTQVYLD